MNYKPYKIVIIYLLLAIFWIITSGLLIKYINQGWNPDEVVYIEIGKGISFVIITSVVLYFLIKRQQENIVKSEKQYRQLFEANPYPMWVYSLETLKFVEINDAAINNYGYSREEFQNMTILDIRKEDEKEKVVNFVRKYKNTREGSGVWRHIKKSGEEILVSVKSFPVNFNNQQCAMVLAVDVTEKVTHQKQLELSYQKEIELNDALAAHIDLIKKSNEENRRMGEIIDKINNFVIITASDGSLRWANKAFLQFSGYSLSEISGRNQIELLCGPATDSSTARSLHEAVTGQKFFSAEIVNYTKNQQQYWAQINISPIYDENGELDCFISVESVITERKIREEKIHNQNKTLRQLAWLSSHKIRRPITSIIGLIDIMKDMEEGDEKNECLKLLEACSLELDTVVKDIAKRVNIAENNQPWV